MHSLRLFSSIRLNIEVKNFLSYLLLSWKHLPMWICHPLVNWLIKNNGEGDVHEIFVRCFYSCYLNYSSQQLYKVGLQVLIWKQCTNITFWSSWSCEFYNQDKSSGLSTTKINVHSRLNGIHLLCWKIKGFEIFWLYLKLLSTLLHYFDFYCTCSLHTHVRSELRWKHAVLWMLSTHV